MKFTIVERKIKIEDELRQYALRKVEKLDRYFQQDSDTTITFSELRGKQNVESYYPIRHRPRLLLLLLFS